MRKKAAPTAQPVQTLYAADLAQVYVEHSGALRRRALRYLKDERLAEEVVQDAFMKVILAGPEINDLEHLHAYLNTTVTNLCHKMHAAQGRGPLLVAVDSETSQDLINDLSAETHVELDDQLVRAEDSAIVREALSRLSEGDRALLIAVEIDEKSNEEIAAMFNLSPSSVRTLVYRARKNLRTVLEEWIIHEETGMTAAQFLSKTYKKAAENSKKIGSAALSLVLLVAAFFGFWNNPNTAVQVASPKSSNETKVVEAQPAPTTPTSQTSSAQATWNPHPLSNWALDLLSKTGPLGWPGLDLQGIPQGFSVNNGAGLVGLALISSDPISINTETGAVSTQSRFTTFQDGLNVIIDQTITNKDGQLFYKATPLVRIGGSWIAIEVSSVSTEIKQLADGTYLITSWMSVDINKTAKNDPIAGPSLGGEDVAHIPALIATRLITTAIGTPINGQAVQVLDPLAGQ